MHGETMKTEVLC